VLISVVLKEKNIMVYSQFSARHRVCVTQEVEMRRARYSRKIVDIFLYYMYIARVAPLFLKPVTLVMRLEGRTT